LSTVSRAPVSYAVFSSLSFYGRRRGGELSGSWLVQALTLLGHTVPAIRQTLFRMERTGVLLARRQGRAKFYRFAPWAQAEADAGLAKILGPAPGRWDGRWTLVFARFETAARAHRERLYDLLRSEGFAPLGGGGFIHPRDRGGRVLEAARQEGRPGRLVVIRGELAESLPVSDVVARHWDIPSLARSYREFLGRFSGFAQQPPADDREVFIVRYALVFAYLEAAWRDPELPADLLPASWPGASARTLAGALYRRLTPAALRYANSLLRRPAEVA
jgi:phenylacetic acid degradation operon negative regulatory protein